MKTTRTLLIAALMAGAAVASPIAAAHASLKSSAPAAGATLTVAPKEIVLTFSEKVEQTFSGITLVDANGQSVGAGKGRVDAANPAILRLATPTMASGTYIVNWAVAGPDGHRRQGEFKFVVK
nr:copper resistance protein CopC [uncultured Duganella sp.]